jgi:hypothetical protein
LSDEPPPEYEVWQGPGETSSFFGCLAAALGLVFIFTGGSCVFIGFGNRSIVMGLIGLMLLGAGWAIMRR